MKRKNSLSHCILTMKDEINPDPKREVFSLFAEMSIPRAYLFGKDGKVVYTSIGYGEEEFRNLMKAVEKALK